MGCTKAGMVNGGKQEICSCKEDGCNGAGQPQMLLAPIACLLTTVALVSHKLFWKSDRSEMNEKDEITHLTTMLLIFLCLRHHQIYEHDIITVS